MRICLRHLVIACGLLATVVPPLPAVADAAPVIEHIEPTSGPAGTLMHIVGRRFGRHATVTVGGQPAAVERGLPNRLSVRIPRDARGGRVVVQSRTGSASGPAFRVTEPPPAPAIESIEPLAGPPGTHVRIRGRNFSPRLAGNLVTFAGRPAVVRSATPLELEVIVPEVENAAPIAVRVTAAGEAHGDRPFRVTAATAIAALEPASGPPGSELVIRGQGFSAKARDNRVFLNSVALRVKSASEDALVVALPREIAGGKILVDVDGAGRAYSARPFRVQRMPTIARFSPERAAPGTRVTVYGTNFGEDADAVEVALGEVALPVREARGTELTVEVVPGARDGKLRVRVYGVGPAESDRPLHVMPTLRVAGFSPRSGTAGSVVEVSGEGFSEVASQNVVALGGRRARVLHATPTQLRIRVPGGRSGPIEVAVPDGTRARTTDPFIVLVPPEVQAVTPMQGPVGAELRIQGKGFGSSPAAVKVMLGDHPLDVRSARDDLLVARVTPGAKTARLKVAVPLQGVDETDAAFEVLGSLLVAGVEPARAAVGETITLRGHGFLAEGTTVEFGGATAPATVLDTRTLTVVVPEGARSGSLRVRLHDGRMAQSPAALEIAAPVAQ